MLWQEPFFFQGILDEVGIEVEIAILNVMILCVTPKKGMHASISVYIDRYRYCVPDVFSCAVNMLL